MVFVEPLRPVTVNVHGDRALGTEVGTFFN